MTMSKDTITIAIEDNSESWAAQIALEQRQQEERETRISTQEILEKLRKCAAILDLCDSRVENLRQNIKETTEKLTLEDKEFRNELKKRLYHLL
tara:strand:- start:568 stop:849 length:282 start_codon:yes stop_codon:yes gene_type:complete